VDEMQGRSSATSPDLGALRGSFSSFAAAPRPAAAGGTALASIERVAPLKQRAPMKQADLQRMAANAARSIRTGDIAGARLILRRAAEGGDATALFALAETYDPRVLDRMRVRGLSGDPAEAKALYEQAAAAGVTAARTRLTQQ
jgi:TPR repeat protein